MSYQNKSYHWVFFYLQPFFTLIYYLVNFRKPAAKNIMWAFTIFFTMTIAIGIESEGADINAYMEDVKLMSEFKWSWNELVKYYQESGEIDVFRIFFSYFLSRFTDNGYILLLFFGFIYGYFYSRNMWFILDRVQGKLKSASILLLFCFFLIVPIWYLGGFRFWTATHVFVFGLLPYLFTGKKKTLLWCFLTPFIFHYAYIVPVLILTIYILYGNRIKIYFYFFLLSLLIGEINISPINSIIESYAPQTFVERSSSYRGEEKAESIRAGEVAETKVWYIRYLNKFIHWPLYLLLILLYQRSYKIIKKDIKLLRLFCFTLFLYGFANIFSAFPSGGRYLSFVGLLAISFMVIYIQNNVQEKLITNAVKFTFPFLILFIIVKIRTSWFLFSMMTLIGNPFIALFNMGENISINDIIKY